MKLSFKYRIYPNKEQERKLFDILNFARFLYNCALEERIAFYKKEGKSRNHRQQVALLSEIKEMFPKETKHIYAQTLQATLNQLDAAYKNFFRRVKQGNNRPGFPKFKNRKTFNSICFPQIHPYLNGRAIKLLDNKHIKTSKIGSVRIEYSRPIRGKAKIAQIIHKGSKWFVSISCDEVPLESLPKTGKTIGIDLGLNSFATTDDGTTFHHPKPYKTSLQKLQHMQRKRELKKKGSNNYKKAIVAEQRLHEKIKNIRSDFHHKLSRKLLEENDVLIIEDLSIKSMIENKEKLAKNSNILDAAWGNFISLLLYKAIRFGRNVIVVDPKNTSKMCSCCGKINNDLTLKDRIYICDYASGGCGLGIDRDLNAAINIKSKGVGTILVAAKAVSEAA